MWTDYQNRRFFSSLDGIRGLSILAVLWHHTVEPFEQLPITSRGFLGVDMFFVMSSFLIVTLLLRERERHNDISLQKFYMRRTLRIFPVYYALLLVLAILFFGVARDSGMAADFRSKFPFYITYTSNWIHDLSILAVTWSLATEEQFYLFYPLLEKYLKKLVLPLMGVFLIINQLINYGILFPVAHSQLEILQSTFTPIIFGVLLAHLLYNQRGFEIAYRLVGERWSAVIFAVALLILINIPAFGSDISGTPRLLIQILMTLLVASVVVREDHRLQPLLQIRPLMRLGVLSYGLYLFHMLVRHVVYAVMARVGLLEVPFLLLIAVTIGTWIAAELSFRFFESPFLKLKKRFVVVKSRD